jgi:hypothetical protein
MSPSTSTSTSSVTTQGPPFDRYFDKLSNHSGTIQEALRDLMGLSGLLWNNPMTASTAFSDRANYKKHIQKKCASSDFMAYNVRNRILGHAEIFSDCLRIIF